MDNVKQPKFKINDNVISKQTGLPSYGRISSVIEGSAYIKFNSKSASLYGEWCQLYPGWEDTFVYSVSFNQPQKSMSLEEFCRVEHVHSIIQELQLDKSQCLVLYSHLVGSTDLITYPEDDLELVE